MTYAGMWYEYKVFDFLTITIIIIVIISTKTNKQVYTENQF